MTCLTALTSFCFSSMFLIGPSTLALLSFDLQSLCFRGVFSSLYGACAWMIIVSYSSFKSEIRESILVSSTFNTSFSASSMISDASAFTFRIEIIGSICWFSKFGILFSCFALMWTFRPAFKPSLKVYVM